MTVFSGSPSRKLCALLTFFLFAPLKGFADDIIFSSGFEQPSNSTVAHPLNDTGITFSLFDQACGDGAQDCAYGRDMTHNDDTDGHAGFSFTKLDMSGNPLPASVSDWACVRDNVTGYVWEVKTDDGGLRDTDNTYTWYNPDPNTNGGKAGTANGGSCTGSDCDTASYVEAVNTLPVALCGYRDWRMPWREELLSIVDYGRVNPAIDTDYFARERAAPTEVIWTGSNRAWNYGAQNSILWAVKFFDTGQTLSSIDYVPRRVRLVRVGDAFSPLGQVGSP